MDWTQRQDENEVAAVVEQEAGVNETLAASWRCEAMWHACSPNGGSTIQSNGRSMRRQQHMHELGVSLGNEDEALAEPLEYRSELIEVLVQRLLASPKLCTSFNLTLQSFWSIAWAFAAAEVCVIKGTVIEAAPLAVQDSCADLHGMVRQGFDAFQPSVMDVVKDVAVPRVLPTAEQLSDKLCALRQFHPRKVSCWSSVFQCTNSIFQLRYCMLLRSRLLKLHTRCVVT